MMDTEVKRIGRNGVSFLSADYFDESLYGLRDQVIIKYDFADISHIYIYSKSGEYLCRAKRRDKAHPMAALLGTADSVEELKNKIKEHRSLKKGTTLLAGQAMPGCCNNPSRLKREEPRRL